MCGACQGRSAVTDSLLHPQTERFQGKWLKTWLSICSPSKDLHSATYTQWSSGEIKLDSCFLFLKVYSCNSDVQTTHRQTLKTEHSRFFNAILLSRTPLLCCQSSPNFGDKQYFPLGVPRNNLLLRRFLWQSAECDKGPRLTSLQLLRFPVDTSCLVIRVK